MRNNYLKKSVPLLLALGLLAGCQQAPEAPEDQLVFDDSAYVETDPVYDEIGRASCRARVCMFV